jgi:formate hydrogenlyase subunit 3/multisubunit Na+/H+ antiporter MnhD subunit
MLLCGVGLMLALLGTLLLNVAPGAASLCLVLGYGAVAGLAPWHGWVAGAAAEAPAAGGIIVTVLTANVPLLAFMRLSTTLAPGLLMAFGLVSLLVGAALLFSRADLRRTVAFSGIAQLGMAVYAIGLGGAIAPLDIALLTLTRTAALQGRGAAPGLWALALLPLFTLFLLAGPTAAYSAWLLAPLGVGALLACSGVFARWPTEQPTGDPPPMLAPMWLALAVVVLLAFAMPRQVADWFGAMAVVR